MAADTTKRIFKRDQELFDFGRAYLSEAFPNPERKGCPSDRILRLLARNPTQGDPSITDHVTCCSPCFNAYMVHLARVKAEAAEAQRVRLHTSIRRSLSFATIAVVLVTAYAFFSRGHNSRTASPVKETPPSSPLVDNRPPTTAAYASVVVDLSDASPQRGARKDRLLTQVIPSSALVDLNVLLPLGSEERVYSVKLSSKRHVVWSGSAEAHPTKGQMSIRIHADFSHVPTGNYDLVVMSKEFRLRVPVVLISAPSERIR